MTGPTWCCFRAQSTLNTPCRLAPGTNGGLRSAPRYFSPHPLRLFPLFTHTTMQEKRIANPRGKVGVIINPEMVLPCFHAHYDAGNADCKSQGEKKGDINADMCSRGLIPDRVQRVHLCTAAAGLRPLAGLPGDAGDARYKDGLRGLGSCRSPLGGSRSISAQVHQRLAVLDQTHGP